MSFYSMTHNYLLSEPALLIGKNKRGYDKGSILCWVMYKWHGWTPLAVFEWILMWNKCKEITNNNISLSNEEKTKKKKKVHNNISRLGTRHVSTSYIPARGNCILRQKNKLKNIKYSEIHIFQKKKKKTLSLLRNFKFSDKSWKSSK